MLPFPPFRHAIPVGLVALLLAIVLMATSSTPDAEMEDLSVIAANNGITLQEAIESYGWQHDFADMVADVRDAFPSDFSEGEILSGNSAKISFSGSVPDGVPRHVSDFTSEHSSVSVSLHADTGWADADVNTLIPSIHYAVMGASEYIQDITTEFNTETARILTTVVLSEGAEENTLRNLQDAASKVLRDQDMGSSGITTSVEISSSSKLTDRNSD